MEWYRGRFDIRFCWYGICIVKCVQVKTYKPKSSNQSDSNTIHHRARAEVIDFSAPYFHSGVSLLAAPKTKSEIPLLAFLLPFSPELWIAIFTSLNITAIAGEICEI